MAQQDVAHHRMAWHCMALHGTARHAVAKHAMMTHVTAAHCLRAWHGVGQGLGTAGARGGGGLNGRPSCSVAIRSALGYSDAKAAAPALAHRHLRRSVGVRPPAGVTGQGAAARAGQRLPRRGWARAWAQLCRY
eukprot:355680-Chlamydomonas_euryale.AAC.6